MTNAIALPQRFIGRIGSVPGADGYGFISLAFLEREDQRGKLLNAFLIHLFPQMANFRTNFDVVNASDEALDEEVRGASEDLLSLGMSEQVTHMRMEVARFKAVRSAICLANKEGSGKTSDLPR